jgi:glycosyltransferase involved in cell wall biosynthesis
MFGGGAERVVLTLLNNLDRQKYEPLLALVKKEGKYLDLIPEDIEVIDLKVTQARYSIFKIYKLIKEKNPDIIFTSLAHLNLLIALIRPFFSKDIRFIARESNTVTENNKLDKYPKINEFLYKKVYKNYDLIITQAEAMKKDLHENFGIDNDKMFIIQNPIDYENIVSKSEKEDIKLPQKYNLLAVGRLSEQKGFDMLLNIIAKLDDSYFLTILGEGELRDDLEKQIKELGIEDRVNLAGFKDNPYAFMKKVDLFVLSSRYEGLPNVVLEANALGVPVVAFDSAGGTGEIIDDGRNGFLVEPFLELEFVKSIKQAKEYDFDKNKIIKETKLNFSSKKIIKEYEKVFNRTTINI